MALKTFYKTLSLFSFILGATLLVSIPISALGAVIGVNNLTNSTNIGFGAFFLVAGVALFVVVKKDKR